MTHQRTPFERIRVMSSSIALSRSPCRTMKSSCRSSTVMVYDHSKSKKILFMLWVYHLALT